MFVIDFGKISLMHLIFKINIMSFLNNLILAVAVSNVDLFLWYANFY